MDLFIKYFAERGVTKNEPEASMDDVSGMEEDGSMMSDGSEVMPEGM